MQSTASSNRKIDDITELLLSIESRLSRVEAKLEDLEKEIVEVKEELRRRNGYMKYTIMILIIILSFVATMFGLGWRPP